MQRRTLLGWTAISLQAPLLAAAPMGGAITAPEGPVVLSVSNRARDAQRGGPALFDMAMLERLPQASFSTRTPWYTQARKFTGPLVREVLAQSGVQGQQLRLVALNDYRVDLPLDDVMQYDVLLARLMDDRPMTVREKGPLFVIYPFDQQLALRNAVHYSRCAWQLRTIEVL